MIAAIKQFFKQRRHSKAYKKIQEGLLSNPQLLFDTKEKFEKAFGVNSATRTQAQWQRLVNVYGLETVAKTEWLTDKEVEIRCKETFSQKFKRQSKMKVA